MHKIRIPTSPFLANHTNGRAIGTFLRLSASSSSVKLCIVAKECALEQKLLLRAPESHIGEIDWYQNK